MKTVLFACVHNTGRSQMAEAFFNRLADPTQARAISGGTEPATAMNPTVVAVMQEVGVDLVAEGHRPKIADLDQLREGDRPISMGCGVELACPARLGRMEDWGLDDPKGQPIEQVRAIRDDIRQRVARLVEELGVRAGEEPPMTTSPTRLQVFDPAMCCPTGVCGPAVDAALVRFAADLDFLKGQGIVVERFNVAQQPAAFVEHAVVRAALDADPDCLPLIVADGRIVGQGSYPATREQVLSLVGLASAEQGCCDDEAGCC